MSITREEDPNASRPGNMSSHLGPFTRLINPEEFRTEQIRVPGYLVRALERNKHIWRVTIEAWMCENCQAGFFVIKVFIPDLPPWRTYKVRKYVFRGDDT